MSIIRTALLSIATLSVLSAAAQSDSTTSIQLPATSKKIQLDEFVFSANKFRENKKNIAQPIQLITRKDIRWANVQTTATLLEQSGNVFVQRSQAGGGSAVLRGFEASRVLMVIDGVRMNNAIYRTGHLQNLITVDNNLLQSVEVMYGPASTLYGSDALGGAIVMTTIKPKLNAYSGNAMVRYSSVNNERTGHADFSIGGGRIASLTSVTYSMFDDLRQGASRNPFYGDFGARNQYVERINGVDSIVKNSDNNIQKFSGYSQVDVMEKILFKPGKHATHMLNLQYSNSSDIPRYDRLTDIRNGKLRYAEWYYGPQERMMAAYQFSADSLSGFVDEVKANISYQKIEESRYQRDAGKNARQGRVENVDVAGFNIDMRKFLGKHEVTAGLDGQYNNINSTAQSEDITNGTKKPIDTRYPDGGSTMALGAVYAQHIYKIANNKLILNDGIRFNFTQLDAKFGTKDFFPFPYDNASQQNTALSGNLGLIYLPGRHLRFALNGSTGFRAPNVDDLAKVFESVGGSRLVVPNPDLKPEYTYNVDFNAAWFTTDKFKWEAGAFYTWFDNAIVVDKYKLNGQDSVMYNGATAGVVAAQNKASAYIYGFTSSLTASLSAHVSLFSTVTFTYGRYTDAAGKESPLDHIPPVYGKTGLQYSRKAFRAEAYAMYNGWKRLQDYSPSGEDNLNYATAYGMPSWYTLNARAAYTFRDVLNLAIALENIMDYNYRTFSSGISAPGRNLVITARYRL